MAKHPTPKRRLSSARRDSRRAHDALTPPTLVRDPETGDWVEPHTVNPDTGRYKGRQVIEIND